MTGTVFVPTTVLCYTHLSYTHTFTQSSRMCQESHAVESLSRLAQVKKEIQALIQIAVKLGARNVALLLQHFAVKYS